MTRVAIMQPYFLPYAGYFRLLVEADLFVISDERQFPRRGWVHRNRLRDKSGALDWLTLPLVKCPVETAISDLRFPPDLGERLAREARRFDAIERPRPQCRALVDAIRQPLGSPADFISTLLLDFAALLGIRTEVVRSSELPRDLDAPGQAYILNVLDHFGATSYVNAPGGRALYDPAAFRARGKRLLFLKFYQGDPASILQRLHDADSEVVRREIDENGGVEDA